VLAFTLLKFLKPCFSYRSSLFNYNGCLRFTFLPLKLTPSMNCIWWMKCHFSVFLFKVNHIYCFTFFYF